MRSAVSSATGKTGNNPSSGWRDVLKEQAEDLERLQALDAELNDDVDHLNTDINNVLKKPSIASANIGRTKGGRTLAGDIKAVQAGSSAAVTKSRASITQRSRGEQHPDDNEDRVFRQNSPIPSSRNSARRQSEENWNVLETNEIFTSLPPPSYGGGDNAVPNSPPSPPSPIDAGEIGTPKGAPDTTVRYQKARIKLLTKQLDDEKELRKHMSEQLNDVQRQLKNEREEGKKMKKRIQLLEVENKRSSTKKGLEIGAAFTSTGNDPSMESLQQEIAALKKDVLTAERIAKQAEANAKAKDAQLKRALEAVSRYKSQASDLTAVNQSGSEADRIKITELESRIRTLEKQRADIIIAFRKQMKLIDILKRQKVHIEAARLLAFTEEEFLKTLDWAV